MSVLIWIYIGGYTPILVNKLKNGELVRAQRTPVRAPPPLLSESRERQALTITAGGGTPMSPHPRSTAERGPAHPPMSVPPPQAHHHRDMACVAPRIPTADPSPLEEAHVAHAHAPIAANRKAQCSPACGPTATARGPGATPVHVPTLMPAPPPWALHRQESLDVRELRERRLRERES
jgi:hypothetical protein